MTRTAGVGSEVLNADLARATQRTDIPSAQFLPFVYRHAMALYGVFERAMYEALDAA
jgi:hypothetical protein